MGLLALLPALSACDCGLVLREPMGPLALGGGAVMTPHDTCAARRELPWCTTQTARGYSRVAVGPEFSAGWDGGSLYLRAVRAGATTLEATAIDGTGGSHAVHARLEARAMDEVRFFTACAAWRDLIHLPTETSVDVRPTLFGGAEVLYGTLDPAPFDLEGLTATWGGSAQRPLFGFLEDVTVTTPAVPGVGIIRSNVGPEHVLRVQAWAPATIPRLSIEPGEPLEVGSPRNTVVTAWATAALDAGVEDRLCVTPGADWRVTASPAEVCRLQTEAGAPSHRFAVVGAKPGECLISATSPGLGLSASATISIRGRPGPDGGSSTGDAGASGGVDAGADGG